MINNDYGLWIDAVRYPVAVVWQRIIPAVLSHGCYKGRKRIHAHMPIRYPEPWPYISKRMLVKLDAPPPKGTRMVFVYQADFGS
jgi:hypothetical protein